MNMKHDFGCQHCFLLSLFVHKALRPYTRGIKSIFPSNFQVETILENFQLSAPYTRAYLSETNFILTYAVFTTYHGSSITSETHTHKFSCLLR